MELKEVKPMVYMIAGKARHGKDETSLVIKKYYEFLNKKVLILPIGSYIKAYAQKISNWDGNEETKPRELLQVLGTSVIRDRIDELFFIKRICEDIKVYSYFFDVIIISDSRLRIEIEEIRANVPNVKVIHVVRPNFNNGLTEEQLKHRTEIDLDNYNRFDIEIINDGTLDDLKRKVEEVLK